VGPQLQRGTVGCSRLGRLRAHGRGNSDAAILEGKRRGTTRPRRALTERKQEGEQRSNRPSTSCSAWQQQNKEEGGGAESAGVLARVGQATTDWSLGVSSSAVEK